MHVKAKCVFIQISGGANLGTCQSHILIYVLIKLCHFYMCLCDVANWVPAKTHLNTNTYFHMQ